MAFGIIGIEIFQTETQGTIASGEQITLGRYTMIYDSISVWDAADGKNVARASVDIYRDGQPVGQVFPRRDYYYSSQQSMTIPGVRSTLEDDFYVLLIGWEPIAADGATFKIYHNPLVNFVWIGGLIFIVGTMVATWPARDRSSASEKSTTRKAYARA